MGGIKACPLACGKTCARDSNMCIDCRHKMRRNPARWCDCGRPKHSGSFKCRNCAIPGANYLNRQDILHAFDGEAFRRKRTELGWEIWQLAVMSGVSEMTIHTWERGVKPIRELVLKVLRALEFKPCETCNGMGMIDPGIPDDVPEDFLMKRAAYFRERRRRGA